MSWKIPSNQPFTCFVRRSWVLFTCTGMTLSDDMLFQRRRILTSARLVMVFNEKRTRDDNLTIVLRILGYDDDHLGFIELYDKDIVVVVSRQMP
ncbi:hypothetical protein BRADI_1g32121v3 [Brachypodium distachyon]|uniref:Uncharacterized protein n=1 Tax=Brachypodium distachyon TaxID=15368 RepID=A0A2K2DMB4_BRADI|nr:hypothetical protein BRADI_1g32121v3 [Brachypodium distachyon]